MAVSWQQRYAVLVAALVWLLIPGSLLAQQGSDSENTPPPKCPEECPYSLSGTVINSATGQPVARALVHASGATETATLSDLKGNFHFEALAGGGYGVFAVRPGFLGSDRSYQGVRAKYVKVGSDTPPVTLKLSPQAVLQGVVTDTDGVPLEGVSVHILRAQSKAGSLSWTQATQESTDELGRYRAVDLVSGKYCVVSAAWSRPGLGPPGRVRNEPWGFASTAFPCDGSTSVDNSLELKPGQERTVNVRLRLTRFYTLTGTVDTAAKESEAPSLYLLPTEAVASIGAVTLDGDGGFHSAPIAPGHYVLSGIVRGTKVLTAHMDIPVTADVSDVRLKFSPAMNIPIVVRADELPPQTPESPGGDATPAGNPHLVSVTLMRSDPVSGMANAFSGLGGSSIGPVVPGAYVPQIVPNGAWYVESATHGGTDLLRENLVVGPGADREPIYIVLRAGCGVIRGTLQGEVDTLTSVIAAPENGKRAHFQYAQVEEGLEFQMPCVPPGDYTVVALQNGTDLEDAPEAVGPYLSQGVHVTVNPGQDNSLTLTARPRGEP